MELILVAAALRGFVCVQERQRVTNALAHITLGDVPRVYSRTKPRPPETESAVLKVTMRPEPEKTSGGSDRVPQYSRLTVSLTWKLKRGRIWWEGMLSIDSQVSPQQGLVAQ